MKQGSRVLTLEHGPSGDRVRGGSRWGLSRAKRVERCGPPVSQQLHAVHTTTKRDRGRIRYEATPTRRGARRSRTFCLGRMIICR